MLFSPDAFVMGARESVIAPGDQWLLIGVQDHLPLPNKRSTAVLRRRLARELGIATQQVEKAPTDVIVREKGNHPYLMVSLHHPHLTGEASEAAAYRALEEVAPKLRSVGSPAGRPKKEKFRPVNRLRIARLHS